MTPFFKKYFFNSLRRGKNRFIGFVQSVVQGPDPAGGSLDLLEIAAPGVTSIGLVINVGLVIEPLSADIYFSLYHIVTCIAIYPISDFEKSA
jgi:hypothetical protein